MADVTITVQVSPVAARLPVPVACVLPVTCVVGLVVVTTVAMMMVVGGVELRHVADGVWPVDVEHDVGDVSRQRSA